MPQAILDNNIKDHNAYANNAEDYFKKTPAGTKTPAEKPSKKLKKAAQSGKLTTTVMKSNSDRTAALV